MQNSPAPPPQITKVIWAALVLSILMYGAVAAFVVIEPETAPPPLMERLFSDPLALALHVAGIGVIFAAFAVSGLLVKSPGQNAAPAYAPPSNPSSDVHPRVRLALIVRWALIESAAIFGLIYALLSGDAAGFIPLGVLSLVAMIASYPSDSLVSKLDEARRA